MSVSKDRRLCFGHLVQVFSAPFVSALHFFRRKVRFAAKSQIHGAVAALSQWFWKVFGASCYVVIALAWRRDPSCETARTKNDGSRRDVRDIVRKYRFGQDFSASDPDRFLSVDCFVIQKIETCCDLLSSVYCLWNPVQWKLYARGINTVMGWFHKVMCRYSICQSGGVEFIKIVLRFWLKKLE